MTVDLLHLPRLYGTVHRWGGQIYNKYITYIYIYIYKLDKNVINQKVLKYVIGCHRVIQKGRITTLETRRLRGVTVLGAAKK